MSLCPKLSSTVCPTSVSNFQCNVCRFESLSPPLSSRVCSLSVSNSHCTVCWFCVTMSTAFLYSLSKVCQYLTQHRFLVLCHCVHCCLLRSVHCLSLSYTVLSLGSVTLCPLLSSKVCPMPVSTSQCIVCQKSLSTSQWTISWFCVTVYTDVSCRYPMPLIPHTVTSVGIVSLYPLLSSIVSPMSVVTSQSNILVVNMATSVFDILTKCLSVPHRVPSLDSDSLCPLLPSVVCTMTAIISHCTVGWFWVTMSTAVLYSLSNVCQ